MFALLSRDFEQIFEQIFFKRVKTLRNTNLEASRHIQKEKGSLPVDVHRSKTSLLKLSDRAVKQISLTSTAGLRGETF